MVEAIGCIGAASSACKGPDVMLQDVVSMPETAQMQQGLFQDIASRAIGRAIAEPAGANAAGMQHQDLTASGGNLVTDRKDAILSSVARTDDKAVPAAEPAVDPMAQTAERIKMLYLDLTEYQVAWKVGHKVQQDISTILRGQ